MRYLHLPKSIQELREERDQREKCPPWALADAWKGGAISVLPDTTREDRAAYRQKLLNHQRQWPKSAADLKQAWADGENSVESGALVDLDEHYA